MSRSGATFRAAWIQSLFDRIAVRYDLLNDILSLGIHRLWKRKAIRHLGLVAGKRILDAATGTGDLAFQLAKANAQVTGVDFSAGMLAVAHKRNTREPKVEFILANVLQLQFPDSAFDASIVAFGVRNFENPARGISELWRVICPGGQLVILEFGGWGRFRVFGHGLNRFSQWFAADIEAYSHLVGSSLEFPAGTDFTQRFLNGLDHLESIHYEKVFFGVAHLYAIKKISLKK